MPRLFIGIKIDPLPFLSEYQSELKIKLQSGHINWVDPLNFHITMKFLGDVDDYYSNSILLLLEQIAAKTNKFTLFYDRLGLFGSAKQPRIIWFGFRKQEDIMNLQLSIEKSLTDLGFKAGEKEFHPHLTLARIKKINNALTLTEYIALKNKNIKGEYPVTKFQLIKSVLHSEGPEYSVLKEFKLH